MGTESFLLGGAPDERTGSSAGETGPGAVQVMHLEMSNEILDELLDCIREGKAPQVLFGKTPLMKYNGKSHELHIRPEKYRREIYRENQENEEAAWEFGGLVNHSLEIKDVEERADRALETLKNTMASIVEEREAKKTTISTPEMRPSKGMTKAQSRATHLKPLLSGNGRSSPSSPGLGASTPSHLRPPTSAGLDMPNDIAIRKALVHYLAVEPRPYLKCRAAVHTNPRRVLEKIARQTGKGEEEWALQDRAYKELDVFKFNYPEEDRQTAIQNAIRVYDRMRLSKDDPLWQKLLPVEERGKGKVLSRLNLKDHPTGGTPALKAQSFDRKTGLPKRKEPKKAEKEAAKAKKAKEDSSPEKPKAMKSAAEGQTPKLEARKQRQTQKRADGKSGDGRTPIRKETKPSSAAKSMLNRPKNGSPLGTPPVNASDFEDTHPVHKALSAATSPRKGGTKRKAEDLNGSSHRPNSIKRPHIDSSTSSSDDQPLQSKVNGTNGTNGLGGRHQPSGNISPDSDSSNGGQQPLALSWRQSLEMARKFNIYYQRYKKLYNELSQSVEPPSERKREELLEMHRRLERMKREVNNGTL